MLRNCKFKVKSLLGSTFVALIILCDHAFDPLALAPVNSSNLINGEYGDWDVYARVAEHRTKETVTSFSRVDVTSE